MYTINLQFLKATKSFYKYKMGRGDDFRTVYLERDRMDALGIDPKEGVVLVVKQQEEDCYDEG